MSNIALERTVTDYLHVRGFKRNHKGFKFLREVIIDCIALPGRIGKTTLSYKRIADKYAEKWQNVERSIRHAIESSNVEKTTNSEFIAVAADDMRINISGDEL